MSKKTRTARRSGTKRSARGRSGESAATRTTSTRSSSAGEAKRSGRKPKKTSAPRDADGIQELAEELRAVADTVDGYANAMRKMRIESIRPLTGNWDLAVAKIRDVINKQILARLLVEADKRGYEAHELFRQ